MFSWLDRDKFVELNIHSSIGRQHQVSSLAFLLMSFLVLNSLFKFQVQFHVVFKFNIVSL